MTAVKGTLKCSRGGSEERGESLEKERLSEFLTLISSIFITFANFLVQKRHKNRFWLFYCPKWSPLTRNMNKPFKNRGFHSDAFVVISRD